MGTRIQQTDLARDALYTKVNQIADEKQDSLVSGTNIKTLNGESILGSGNMDVGSDNDNLSITKNSSDKIQTIGVINQNSTSTAIKTWTGTKAQYDAIATKDNNTLYNITDDDTAVVYQAYTKSETDEHISIALNNVLSALYPIGSIYIGTQSTCPLENLISGSTWEKVSGDKALQTSSSHYAANTTIAAGLPNITGYSHGNCNIGNPNDNGGAIRTFKLSTQAFYGTNTSQYADSFEFDASRSNPIYGNSLTVQPPAYVVNVWRRTA